MIRAEALSKTFQTRGGPVHAVRNASLEVASGEIYGLLGPNGAGKTTLLRMLATIIAPTSGQCLIEGRPVPPAAEGMRRKLGFLSGNTKLYARLTARETLQYFGRLYGMSRTAIASRITELAGSLAFEDLLNRRCDALSTGQLQKVNLSRVLLHDPPVLILDEPTLGLDILSSHAILGLIETAQDRGRAIVYSTHTMTEAERLCGRIGLMHRGRILAQGPQEQLLTQTHTGNLQDAFLSLIHGDAL